MKVIDYHEAIFASKLSSNAKLTALIISSYYNWTKNQMCWPSNATLAKGTSLSIRSITRATKELKEAGYLEVWHRNNNSNMYKPIVNTSSHNGSQVLTQSLINNEYNNEINNEDIYDIQILSDKKIDEFLSW